MTAPTGQGRTVRVHEVPGSGVVSIQVWLRGGARAEWIPGQASITGRMMVEGTHSRDWRKISTDAEELGMALDSFGGFEVMGVSVEALANDWRVALEWALESAREPSFPSDRCALLVRQNQAEIQALGDQPEIRTAWRFLDQLYRPHPRCRPVQGTSRGLARISRQRCAELHSRSLAAGLIVSVAGEIDEDEVRRLVDDLIEATGSEAATAADPHPPKGMDLERQEVPLPAAEQAHLLAGHLTIARNHPDFPALQLLAVVLGAGSGLSGRLPLRVREQEGLAYSVETGTSAGAGLDVGRLFVHIGTSPELLERAELCVREELARLVDEGPQEAEVEEARSYLLGREPFRRETPHQLAELSAAAELYGLPIDDAEWTADRWRSVGAAEIAAAVRRHIRPDDLRITVGTPRVDRR